MVRRPGDPAVVRGVGRRYSLEHARGSARYNDCRYAAHAKRSKKPHDAGFRRPQKMKEEGCRMRRGRALRGCTCSPCHYRRPGSAGERLTAAHNEASRMRSNILGLQHPNYVRTCSGGASFILCLVTVQTSTGD